MEWAGDERFTIIVARRETEELFLSEMKSSKMEERFHEITKGKDQVGEGLEGWRRTDA